MLKMNVLVLAYLAYNVNIGTVGLIYRHMHITSMPSSSFIFQMVKNILPTCTLGIMNGAGISNGSCRDDKSYLSSNFKISIQKPNKMDAVGEDNSSPATKFIAFITNNITNNIRLHI